MGLPMFAPFIKKLFHNLESNEGPFLVSFLQISGLSLILMVRSELGEVPPILSFIVAGTALISAFYVALLALKEPLKRIAPYYHKVFYSSLVCALVFCSPLNSFLPMTQALFLLSLLCFFQTAKISLISEQIKSPHPIHAKMRAAWFISLSLLVGIPGFGVGAALWPIFYFFVDSGLLDPNNPWSTTWTIIALLWASALMLFSLAIIANVRKETILPLDENITINEKRITVENKFMFSWIFLVILSWLIPIFAYREIFNK